MTNSADMNNPNSSASTSFDDNSREQASVRRAAALKKRNAAEKRFQWAGRISIAFGIACVLFLFTDIFSKGISAFTQTYLDVDITFDADKLGLHHKVLRKKSRPPVLVLSLRSLCEKNTLT